MFVRTSLECTQHVNVLKIAGMPKHLAIFMANSIALHFRVMVSTYLSIITFSHQNNPLVFQQVTGEKAGLFPCPNSVKKYSRMWKGGFSFWIHGVPCPVLSWRRDKGYFQKGQIETLALRRFHFSPDCAHSPLFPCPIVPLLSQPWHSYKKLGNPQNSLVKC